MANLYEIRQRAQRAEGMGQQPASSTARDYSPIYRAITTFHERHNPPRFVDGYWETAVDEMREIAASLDNDRFAIALLSAVYCEMEREYKRLEASRAGQT